MDLMNLMQGKATYRAAYMLIFAGVYLMAVQIGYLLPGDPVFLAAEVLKEEGFKLFMAGWGLWGLRRAMAKGGAEAPPLTEEEKQQEAQKLQSMLTDIEEQLRKMKGTQQ